MTDSNKQADYQKAQELLPWFVKGQLSAEDSSWVSKQLESEPELRDELHLIQKQISFTKNYIDQLDTKAYEDNSERLASLINKIEAGNEKAHFNNKPDKNNLWTKLLSVLPQSQGAWQTAGVLALGIMVIQGVVISQLSKTEPDKIQQGTEYTTLSGEDSKQQAGDQLVLLTRFDLNATVYEVDSILTKYNLSIINGPDAGGIYQLTANDKLSEDAIDKMISELEAQDKIIKFIAREN